MGRDRIFVVLCDASRGGTMNAKTRTAIAAGLLLLIGLTGCAAQTVQAKVIPPEPPVCAAGQVAANLEFDGATNLLPNHLYGIGVWRTGPPIHVTNILTDNSGNISDPGQTYGMPCPPGGTEPGWTLEVYDLHLPDKDTLYGTGPSTKLSGPLCLPCVT
jgi:hypothetical protein